VGGKGDLPRLEALRDLAPRDHGIVRLYVRRRYYLAPPTPAEFDDAYGQLVEYDVTVMKERAALLPADREATRALLQRACDLDGDSCVDLGSYLAGQDLDDDAARAFQRAVDESRDRVALSNDVAWLVDYYLDHGQDERARVVARMAADVHSARGLAAMGRYSERRGDGQDAERHYKMVAERYGDQEYLQAFYVRADLRAPGGRFAAEADAARRSLFTEGMVGVTLPHVQGPPADGVRIVRSLPRLERLGLEAGDVIVAVNGYRVQNRAQFDCLRALDAREATVTVWHGGRYDEVKAPLAGAHTAARFQSLRGEP
jgi:hypothetical protein